MLEAASPKARAATLLLAVLALSPATGPAQEPKGEAPLPSVELPQPLARVLRDYESAWQRKDARGLAALFAEDGFVLSGGKPPVRGRAAIEKHYQGSGGALALRALAFSTAGDVGYILGGYARRAGESDVGKFTLTLRRGDGGRWLIVSDMDNDNGRQARPTPAARYEMTDVDTAHGDREFHLLWPGGAPGALGDAPADKPKLTPYLPPAGEANGAAVVVCPGGGYARLASDHEGKQVAEWLNSFGVSAFVLQYRLGPRYRHPVPLQDAQRAIRLVRSRAAEWGVDPARVGILGFSAGGHLASTAATHFDDGRPDAADPVERHGCAARLRGARLSRHLARRPAGALGVAPQPARRSARPGARRAAEQREAGHRAHAADLPVPHGGRHCRAGRELAAVLRGAAARDGPVRAARLPARHARRGPRRGRSRCCRPGRGSAPPGWARSGCSSRSPDAFKRLNPGRRGFCLTMSDTMS